jgi:alanine-synthesizing transaminase
MKRQHEKTKKLHSVRYEIRGPLQDRAKQLEAEGHKVIKLNIGNPGPFGFLTPDVMLQDMTENLKKAEGYSDSKGIIEARHSIMKDANHKGIPDIGPDDIFIGNGVSELIIMTLQALLNPGDEVLIPTPDYPLWTAAVNFSGGKAVHYLCDEENEWNPDLADMEKKITNNTKAIVVINPNNPTGAVYHKDILEHIIGLARKHDLAILSDEVYERILYFGLKHIPTASLANDILFVTFNGLSKSHLICGFRVGWMMISGDRAHAKGFYEGMNLLASMRLCSNVQAQYVIPTALEKCPNIDYLIHPGGRLYEQTFFAHKLINDIPGVSCVKPKGAFYLFPKLDQKKFNIHDDQKLFYDLLEAEKILFVNGTGFNWPKHDHFRVVALPKAEDLEAALKRLGHFLSTYHQ